MAATDLEMRGWEESLREGHRTTFGASPAVFGYVRDCQVASATDMAVRGRLGACHSRRCEKAVHQRMEGRGVHGTCVSWAESGVWGNSSEWLKVDQVKEQI